MTGSNFERMADKMSAHAQSIADVLIPLNSEMPGFIAELSPMGRFVAVGALWATGNIPHQDVVTALLFEPASVGFAYGDSYDDAAAQMGEAPPDHDEYVGYLHTSEDEPLAQWERDLLASGVAPADVATDSDGTSDVTDFGRMVRMAEHGDVEIYNTATETTYTDTDIDIYNTASSILASHPDAEGEIVRAVTAVGLDWPQGSGNFHGSIPFEQMTEIDRMRALIEVYGIVDRLVARDTRDSNAA